MGVTLDVFNREADGERVEAGGVIFSAGDEGHVMYVILEGEVELRMGASVIASLGRGEPFGEMALIDHSPRVATAIAKTPCVLAQIPEKRFLFMVQQHPYFALQLMRVIADRLRTMDRLSVAAAN